MLNCQRVPMDSLSFVAWLEVANFLRKCRSEGHEFIEHPPHRDIFQHCCHAAWISTLLGSLRDMDGQNQGLIWSKLKDVESIHSWSQTCGSYTMLYTPFWYNMYIYTYYYLIHYNTHLFSLLFTETVYCARCVGWSEQSSWKPGIRGGIRGAPVVYRISRRELEKLRDRFSPGYHLVMTNIAMENPHV